MNKEIHAYGNPPQVSTSVAATPVDPPPCERSSESRAPCCEPSPCDLRSLPSHAFKHLTGIFNLQGVGLKLKPVQALNPTTPKPRFPLNSERSHPSLLFNLRWPGLKLIPVPAIHHQIEDSPRLFFRVIFNLQSPVVRVETSTVDVLKIWNVSPV